MSQQSERIASFGLLVLLFIVAIWLTVPDVRSSREAARAPQCKNNLRVIGMALHNYRDQYGSFPPAYIADEHGRPMHSWRTLLLPFLDHGAVYEKYRFDEPWDGPNNSQLHSTSIAVFVCPGDQSSRPGGTNFLAVVGPETAWPGDQPAGEADFADGMERTILVVEVADSGIRWMEPRDLNIEDMSFTLNDRAGRSISSHHTMPGEGDRIWPWTKTVPYVHVLFADGMARRIRGDTPPEIIRVLLTPNGGEEISLEGREP